MAPKVAIVYYSMYGHVRTLAEAEKKGIEKAGGSADLYQIQETLPTEVLEKMYAPTSQTGHSILSDPKTLEEYDAVLFGIPTRYGNFPAQWKTFWDKTGGQWQSGAYWGKYAGVFVSTATQGGGQESTAMNAMSTLVHHGFIYVPLGYKTSFHILGDNSEVRGGSPWGAGTFSNGDGSRQPTEKELELATIQGESFYKAVDKAHSACLHEPEDSGEVQGVNGAGGAGVVESVGGAAGGGGTRVVEAVGGAVAGSAVIGGAGAALVAARVFDAPVDDGFVPVGSKTVGGGDYVGSETLATSEVVDAPVVSEPLISQPVVSERVQAAPVVVDTVPTASKLQKAPPPAQQAETEAGAGGAMAQRKLRDGGKEKEEGPCGLPFKCSIQ